MKSLATAVLLTASLGACSNGLDALTARFRLANGDADRRRRTTTALGRRLHRHARAGAVRDIRSQLLGERPERMRNQIA